MKKIFLAALAGLLCFAASAQPPAGGEASPEMQHMQQRMQQMRQQMERIRATEDRQERQRLMREHMESMHQGMTEMGGMMRRQSSDTGAERCSQADTECRMEKMEAQQRMMGQRMGMMQMMMEQMMEQMMQRQATETDGAEHP